MTLKVVLEDDDCVIVEKPAGISTLTRDGSGAALASLLVLQFPELKHVGGADWGAVHRLDRETSGLVVFARNEETYRRLRGMFSKNEVEKEYTALVEGTIREAGRIDWPIGPDPKTKKKVKVYRNPAEARRNSAQEALTVYSPLSRYGGSQKGTISSEGPGVRGETRLEVTIKTGRRHQIRAHLASIGHPIVGDVLYGGPKADRLYLHASRVKFRHPSHREWVEASSPAPFS